MLTLHLILGIIFGAKKDKEYQRIKEENVIHETKKSFEEVKLTEENKKNDLDPSILDI